MSVDREIAGSPAEEPGLTPEPGCSTGAKWRTETSRRYSRAVALRLGAVGFRETTPEFAEDRFHSFLHASRHQVVFVPSTGRIQVRVDCVTPLEDRREAAVRIADLFVGAFRGEP